MRRSLLAVAVLTVWAGQTALHAGPVGDDTKPEPGRPLQLRVHSPVAMAPATLRLFIKIAPDADNRLLRITADSGASFRSSELQLEGLDSPKSYLHVWNRLAPGDYCLEATLVRVTGRELTTRFAYRVLGAGRNPGGIPAGVCLSNPGITSVAEWVPAAFQGLGAGPSRVGDGWASAIAPR